MGDSTIHVAHIMPQLAFAGAELQLYTLIVNSDPNTVVHEVVCYEESDQNCVKLFEDAGIKITRIYRNRRRPLKFLYELSRTIRACKADIVHCWLFSASFWGRWGAILAGAGNILVAYRNCNLPRARALRFLEMFSPGKRVHYLANSRAVAEFVGRALNLPVDEFAVVYNGIDLERFDVVGDKKGFKESLGIPPGSKVAVTLGRLVRQKNYPMLLKLAHRCMKEELPLHFVIAGRGQKEAELRRLSEELQVNNIVHFIGVNQDVPRLLRSSDYFCFTTLFEGFPNVLLEAMAARLPVVTTDFAGVCELLEDKLNGSIVAIDDVDSAYEALKAYYDDPGLGSRIGNAARKTAEDKFSAKMMAANTLNVYKKILAG